MKKNIGFLLYGLLGLLLAPAASRLAISAANQAALGTMAGVWLASTVHMIVYIPMGAYLALYAALASRRALWPGAVLCVLSGALALLSNAVTMQFVPPGSVILEFYAMDILHVWKLLFGFTLIHTLWTAHRRRRPQT